MAPTQPKLQTAGKQSRGNSYNVQCQLGLLNRMQAAGMCAFGNCDLQAMQLGQTMPAQCCDVSCGSGRSCSQLLRLLAPTGLETGCNPCSAAVALIPLGYEHSWRGKVPNCFGECRGPRRKHFCAMRQGYAEHSIVSPRTQVSSCKGNHRRRNSQEQTKTHLAFLYKLMMGSK